MTPPADKPMDRSEAVERTRLVRQRQDNDCTVAAVAMATGQKYEAVMSSAIFSLVFAAGETPSLRHVDEYLIEHGYAQQKLFRYTAGGRKLRSPWPPRPWAPIHICDVQTSRSHAVVMLVDGRVLDPLDDKPRVLSDYAEVNSVCGLFLARAVLAMDEELRKAAGSGKEKP